MKNLHNRLHNLVSVLASPQSEIIGLWLIGDIYIDSISAYPDGSVILCMWSDSLEYQLDSKDLSDEEVLDLIEQLEQILLN